ncbi:AMP-binding protein [Nocardia sp. NPDC004340]
MIVAARDDIFMPADADQFRELGLWRRHQTLVDDLIAATTRYPDKDALVCYRGRRADRFSYRQLSERVHRTALLLRQAGVTAGDVVALQLPNAVELIVLCLAANAIGAVPAPILPAMRSREVRFILESTAATVYVGIESHRGYSISGMLHGFVAELPALRWVLLVAGESAGEPDARGHGFADYAEWEAAFDPRDPGPTLPELAAQRHPDEVCQLMFTSGTTGEPKGVLHSHNTLYAMNSVQARELDLGPETVTCMGSPTSHQAGYTWNFVMPLILGATAVQVWQWDPDEMLDILEWERATFFMGAPTFLTDLIAAQRQRPRALGALTSFVTGSAPIAPHLTAMAHSVLGCRLYSEWGMTENGCVTVTRRTDSESRASESDGTVVEGMRVRIIGSDGESISAPGVVGELQARGASQCLGYFRRPPIYRECLTDDGWFRTGDLARWTGPGEIRISGRAKDVISRGGEKIPVAEVESAILGMAAVRDIAIVAVPHERLGEQACAVLVTDGSQPSVRDIAAHLEGLGMAKIYWPEQVRIVSALPRTTTGKVQKFLLREMENGGIPQ